MRDEAPQSTTPTQYTIFIVDDDDRVRQTLAILLRWTGEWEIVGETTHGNRAVAAASALHPDLILLDLWLPDGNSLRLVPSLRALDPPPRIVMLTADDTEIMRQEAQAVGVDGYLLKMMPPNELLAALRSIMEMDEESGGGS